MSKFDQLISTYLNSFRDDMGREAIDETLLRAIAKSMGPSIYRQDASIVACSKPEELLRVKKSFLIKKMGMADSEELDQVIQEVCEEMGSKNRKKYRVMFYYCLVEKFKKQSHFVDQSQSESTTSTAEDVSDDSADNPAHEPAEDLLTGESSEKIIARYALYAAGAGIIPIPLVDLASISAIQFNMIKALSRRYPQVSFDADRTKSLVAAIVGGISSFELGLLTRLIFRGIPFFGPVVGGTAMSAYAYLSTKIIGEIFDDHFAEGGDLSLEERTIQKMRETFQFSMKKGRAD